MYRYVFIFIVFSSLMLFAQNDMDTNSIMYDIIKNRAYITERDKLTSKINIFTSWKNTQKYMRENSFRFFKRYGRTLTLEFRYRYPYYFQVASSTPIIFMFDDGSTLELTNIQKTVYSPFTMGNLKYYDIEVKYKFNDDNEFDSFTAKSISNIRFNFINNFNENTYEDIAISPTATSNWQSNFTMFRDAINKLEEIQNSTNAY